MQSHLTRDPTGPAEDREQVARASLLSSTWMKMKRERLVPICLSSSIWTLCEDHRRDARLIGTLRAGKMLDYVVQRAK
jgi:hypothetical protein